ncbi:MAG: EamA family transporter [Rubrivivax sp.]
MRSTLFALLSICLSVGAQFILRSAVAGRTFAAEPLVLLRDLGSNGRLLFGLLLYGLSAVVWLKVLSQWEVSKAYPLVGAGFALTVVVGWMLGEQVALQRVAGVLLICAGVYLVARS